MKSYCNNSSINCSNKFNNYNKNININKIKIILILASIKTQYFIFKIFNKIHRKIFLRKNIKIIRYSYLEKIIIYKIILIIRNNNKYNKKIRKKINFRKLKANLF
jgi:hypothetical protein